MRYACVMTGVYVRHHESLYNVIRFIFQWEAIRHGEQSGRSPLFYRARKFSFVGQKVTSLKQKGKQRIGFWKLLEDSPTDHRRMQHSIPPLRKISQEKGDTSCGPKQKTKKYSIFESSTLSLY